MRDWVDEAQGHFDILKPTQFTDRSHCSECAEHDETLSSEDVDTIGLDALGNLGWDPITFSSVEGKLYYIPALIRLSLESIDGEFYFSQFLFHLTWDGAANPLVLACSPEQRTFMAEFIAFIMTAYPGQMDNDLAADDALHAHEIWAQAG